MTVPAGLSGCWCAVPGQQKVLSCTQLETCLQDCADPTGACGEQCFGQTTAEAIRLLGTLMHCVHDGCKATCDETPEACAGCLAQGLAAGTGACGLARSVCDNDRNDEPYWPYE